MDTFIVKIIISRYAESTLNHDTVVAEPSVKHRVLHARVFAGQFDADHFIDQVAKIFSSTNSGLTPTVVL